MTATWRLIFKDERKMSLQKRLRLASADSPEGPWKSVSEPFTHAWVEGPSAIRIGQDWWIYFELHRAASLRASTTRDWKTFKDVTSQLSFPDDHRHGTVVRITKRKRNCSRSTPGESGQQFLFNRARDVGQPEMAALEFECQPLVIDAEAMQHGRLQIMDVHRIADDVVAEIIGFAEH